MQISIKAIGKLNTNLQDIANSYLKRFKILKINIEEHSKSNKNLEWLFNNPMNSYNVALSEYGNTLTSVEFSNFLFSLNKNNCSKITFLIGGSNGINHNYIKKANYILSFGKLTYPHEIFRILLIEQLYRAETIFLNHPYHK